MALSGIDGAHSQTLHGPLPYLQESDSPFFADILVCFVLVETFEDGLCDLPGVTGSAGSPLGPAIFTDSVDGDDGVVDGSGNDGWSLFAGNGQVGITFTFSGTLPTKAGIVWTDGMGTVTFQAFDENGDSLGVFPTHVGDDSNFGGTGEDRFFGAENADGISSIFIRNTDGGFEVDHLQFSLLPFVAGDTNGDGEVSLLDVVPFVNLLTAGAYIPEADINCDGKVTLLDVAPFVETAFRHLNIAERNGKQSLKDKFDFSRSREVQLWNVRRFMIFCCHSRRLRLNRIGLANLS